MKIEKIIGIQMTGVIAMNTILLALVLSFSELNGYAWGIYIENISLLPSSLISLFAFSVVVCLFFISFSVVALYFERKNIIYHISQLLFWIFIFVMFLEFILWIIPILVESPWIFYR